jgi:hypothetical protein
MRPESASRATCGSVRKRKMPSADRRWQELNFVFTSYFTQTSRAAASKEVNRQASEAFFAIRPGTAVESFSQSRKARKKRKNRRRVIHFVSLFHRFFFCYEDLKQEVRRSRLMYSAYFCGPPSKRRLVSAHLRLISCSPCPATRDYPISCIRPCKHLKSSSKFCDEARLKSSTKPNSLRSSALDAR